MSIHLFKCSHGPCFVLVFSGEEDAACPACGTFGDELDIDAAHDVIGAYNVTADLAVKL